MKYSLFIFVSFLMGPLMIFQAAEPKADRKEHLLPLGKSNAMEVEFQVGPAGKVGLLFKFAGGKSQALTGMVKDDQFSRMVTKDGKKTLEKESMPDGYIEFQGAGLKADSQFFLCNWLASRTKYYKTLGCSISIKLNLSWFTKNKSLNHM